MKRLACTAALLLLMPLPGGAGGSVHGVPDIHECGRIDRKRKPPAYQLINARLKGSPERRVGKHVYKHYAITMKFRDYGELVLYRYQDKKADWSGMCGRDVAVGWLEGSRDLLLICWASSGRGSSYRHSLVARVARKRATPLLKHGGQTSIRRAYMDYRNGLEYFHYSYDPKKRLLVNRMSVYREINASKSGPLLHPIWDADDRKTVYQGVFRETVTHRYRYRRGRLSSDSIEI